MPGGGWNDFPLGDARRDIVACRFCVGAGGDGVISFGNVSFLPFWFATRKPGVCQVLSPDRGGCGLSSGGCTGPNFDSEEMADHMLDFS